MNRYNTGTFILSVLIGALLGGLLGYSLWSLFTGSERSVYKTIGTLMTLTGLISGGLLVFFVVRRQYKSADFTCQLATATLLFCIVFMLLMRMILT
jgi:hypothetical protein